MSAIGVEGLVRSTSRICSRPELIAQADWIIDIGPEGGSKGGEIVFTGTPEQILTCKESKTGKYL